MVFILRLLINGLRTDKIAGNQSNFPASLWEVFQNRE